MMPSSKGLMMLLRALIKEKTLIYVATEIGHDSTARLERWIREGDVPDSHKWVVLLMLEREGILK